MPSPRLAPVRVLLATTSRGARGSRVLFGLIVVTGVVARLAVIATARQVAEGAVVSATAIGFVVAAAYGIQRLLQSQLRVRIEVDLYRAASTALVEGDVLRAATADLQRAFFDGVQRARGLLATSLPGAVSDLLVCLAIVPLLCSVLPMRVLVIAMLALFAVLASIVVLRRVTERQQTQMLASLQDVYEQLLVAIEGRLELVARGGEDAFTRARDGVLGRYSAIAARTSLHSAVIGRAPLVAGVVVVSAAILLDGASRDSVSATVLHEALLMAACLPPLLGVIVGAHDLVRDSALVAPFVAILTTTPRDDGVARGVGSPPPPFPFDVTFRDVSFRYAHDARLVLDAVSVEWPKGSVLLVEGPNGAGKSTFLRLVLALGEPERGAILFGGVAQTSLDVRALRANASYAPQEPYLGEPFMTVRAALRMAKEDSSDAELERALGRVELWGALRARADAPLAVTLGTLSAGQRQRVALARVLLADAALVVLDEPDAYLDGEGVALVATLVGELAAAGKMVAIAAHSRAFETTRSVRVTLTP